MRSHGSSLRGFPEPFPDNILQNYEHIPRTCSLKFDFEMRRHISILKRGYIELYMDILQKQIVSI